MYSKLKYLYDMNSHKFLRGKDRAHKQLPEVAPVLSLPGEEEGSETEEAIGKAPVLPTQSKGRTIPQTIQALNKMNLDEKGPI